MFVYMLAGTLEETNLIIFGDNSLKPAVVEQKLPYYYMLSLGLEGRCGINDKHETLAVFGHKRLREYPVSGGPSTLRVSYRDDKLPVPEITHRFV
jgi:hypothetical protein